MFKLASVMNENSSNTGKLYLGSGVRTRELREQVTLDG